MSSYSRCQCEIRSFTCLSCQYIYGGPIAGPGCKFHKGNSPVAPPCPACGF